MRKVIFQMLTSLDGYFEGQNKEIDWHIVDAEFNEYAINFFDNIDIILFGQKTFELMANYWPMQEALINDPIIAKKMNSLPKIVFSTILSYVTWQNTRLVKENIVKEIKKVKQQPGKNIAIFGSSDMSLSLIQNNLIDEYRIFLNPVI